MAYHAAPRAPGFDYVGEYAYLLTICTFGRRPVAVIPDVADVIALKFLRFAAKHLFEITAYCLMPDHIHLVTRGLTQGSDLRLFVGTGKCEAAKWFKREFGGHLWQQGFDDRILRADQSIIDTVAYVVENPVRAGFVATPEAWPFIGSSVWSRQDLVAAVLDRRVYR